MKSKIKYQNNANNFKIPLNNIAYLLNIHINNHETGKVLVTHFYMMHHQKTH